jgi:integrase
VGKWFQRFLRAPSGLGIRDPRLVFHSFRHTFKTLCRAAVIPEDVHDALTGHLSASVSRTYGEMPLAPLVAAMATVSLPVALPRVTAPPARSNR